MALAQTLTCRKRELKSKGYLKQMLKSEWIPGIVYGHQRDNIPIFLSKRPLNRVFSTYGYRGLFALEVEGEKSPLMALVREVQKGPLNGEIIHIDFLAVDMSEKLQSVVGIYTTGEESLIENGKILQQGLKEIEVSCLPQDLPQGIYLEVSTLNVGEKVLVADLSIPAGVEVLTDPETMVVMVLVPTKAVEEAAGEAEAEEAAPGEAPE